MVGGGRHRCWQSLPTATRAAAGGGNRGGDRATVSPHARSTSRGGYTCQPDGSLDTVARHARRIRPVVAGVVCFFWKNYSFRPLNGILLGVLFGIVGITLWILPSFLYGAIGYTEDTVGIWKYFGLAPRDDGFDPSVLLPEFGSIGYWGATVLRFVRAVVVVAIVEELFWRGFLMRFLVDRDGDYWRVPFGKPQLLSYLVTTGAFMLIHQPVDYLGALVFGSLMYWLAVRTKSLAACVVMHAVANLLMGIYALHFSEFGLW